MQTKNFEFINQIEELERKYSEWAYKLGLMDKINFLHKVLPTISSCYEYLEKKNIEMEKDISKYIHIIEELKKKESKYIYRFKELEKKNSQYANTIKKLKKQISKKKQIKILGKKNKRDKE